MKKNDIPVSMAVVPLLKGNAAMAIKNDFKAAKLKRYSNEERKATDERIASILGKRKHR